MKNRRLNEPHWSVPLEELEPGIKRMLNIQLRRFIYCMEEVESISFEPTSFECDYLESCWRAA